MPFFGDCLTMAKPRGKGYRNPQSSDYQTSRLKLNNSLHIHSKKNNNKKNYKKTQ